MFIFDRCRRSSAAVAPVKYECDWNNLTGAFTRSKIMLTEKLTNGALVTPTPGLLGGALLWPGTLVGNIYGEQNRAKGGIHVVLRWPAVSFLKQSLYFVPMSSLRKIWRNHFEAVPSTPKPERKISNKVLWSVLSNAALRSSMTRRVTFWSSMFIKISDCIVTSGVSVLGNGL